MRVLWNSQDSCNRLDSSSQPADRFNDDELDRLLDFAVEIEELLNEADAVSADLNEADNTKLIRSLLLPIRRYRLQCGRMTQEPNPTETTSEIVYVVDDDPGIREGLSDLLDSCGISSCEFDSCEAFLHAWKDGPISCLLLDVQLPGMTGIELQERLASDGVQIPIIFMTAHADVPMVRKVLKAGAVEFLTKPIDTEELLAAIQTALNRDRARRQRDQMREILRMRLESLTDREREVLRYVTQGLLNKQIASEMNLSEITVKLYRRQVMDKMQAQSVADLAKMVAEYQGTAGPAA